MVFRSSGQLIKVHGGAVSKHTVYSSTDEKVSNRKEQNREAKVKIARYAASLIEEGDFVYIDASTTTELMIEYISVKTATYVTNAITHAKKLADQGFNVYLIGGEFKAITEAIVGEEAVENLEKFNFTKGFWGTNGISIKRGYTTPELKEALVKRRSMKNCRECYIVTDDSKFNQISSVTFAPFESATVITTEITQTMFKEFENVIEI